MKTVTIKFVVADQHEADELVNEIAEDIGNNAGYPFLSSAIDESTSDEIAAHKGLIE